MTAKELFTYLTQDAGLDEQTAAIISKLGDNPKVTERASALKQKAEYDAIEAQKAAIEASYKQAKTYQDWYGENHAKLTAMQEAITKYNERYGPLDASTQTTQQTTQTTAAGAKPEDIQRLVDERIQTQYGPQWSSLLKGSGRLIEKHLRAGRKNEIDWDKVSEIAAQNGGDLVQAYDTWDAPEREAAQKTAAEAEIQRRVNEELAKRQSQQFFPAGADAAASSGQSSPLGRRSTADAYDRNKVIQSAVSGEYSPKQVQ